MINGKDNKMSEEDMSTEIIIDNKPAAEPRFKVGDVVWSPTRMYKNDNPVFMESKIIALYYMRANGKSVFSGYKIIDNGDRNARKPEAVFATKEECEAFIDNILAPKTKERREGSKMEELGKFLKKLGELMDKESDEEEE